MVKCKDASLYVGFTNDIEKRLYAHNHLKSGAKYTKGRRPVRLVHTERFKTLSEAKKREWAIKQLTRRDKFELIKNKK